AYPRAVDAGPVTAMRVSLSGGAKVGQNRQYAPVALWRRADVELSQHAVDVGFHGFWREMEPASDGFVRVALCHRCENLALAFGECVEWARVAGLAQELLDDRGVDHAFPFGDPFERVDENGDVGDALLEQ